MQIDEELDDLSIEEIAEGESGLRGQVLLASHSRLTDRTARELATLRCYLLRARKRTLDSGRLNAYE